MDVNSPRKLLDLTLERDGAAAVPLADLEAKQLVIPPGRFGGVRVFAATGDGDQALPTEQQQVAVRDLRTGVGERNELWLIGWRHDWTRKTKKARRRTQCPTTGSLDAALVTVASAGYRLTSYTLAQGVARFQQLFLATPRRRSV